MSEKQLSRNERSSDRAELAKAIAKGKVTISDTFMTYTLNEDAKAILVSALSEKRGPDEESPALAADARRYRRLCDAAGRTWDKLAGAHLTGQLDKAIDSLGDDE